MLQALAHEAQGESPSAFVPLERALMLAEPEDFIRIFVDEGMPMARLLSKAAAHGIMPDYTARLLAVFEAEEPQERRRIPSAPCPICPTSRRAVEPARVGSTGGSSLRDSRIERSARGSSSPLTRSKDTTAKSLASYRSRGASKP